VILIVAGLTTWTFALTPPSGLMVLAQGDRGPLLLLPVAILLAMASLMATLVINTVFESGHRGIVALVIFALVTSGLLILIMILITILIIPTIMIIRRGLLFGEGRAGGRDKSAKRKLYELAIMMRVRRGRANESSRYLTCIIRKRSPSSGVVAPVVGAVVGPFFFFLEAGLLELCNGDHHHYPSAC